MNDISFYLVQLLFTGAFRLTVKAGRPCGKPSSETPLLPGESAKPTLKVSK
jgi:hypothetical protein